MTAFTSKRTGQVMTGFQYKGPLGPIPPWFQEIVKVGKAKLPTENSPFEVKIITGRWWPVYANDWVICTASCDVYHVDDTDVHQLFEFKEDV
ncbi:MAG: hypothetical protein [Bacteriophage sp.]|nr:MAG: hypothetical protein [Bacteriophage sp.]